jgi:hypothetical protein
MDLYKPTGNQTIRFLCPTGQNSFVHVRSNSTAERRIDRFYWWCVVRGQEDQGVKVFMMPSSFHRSIIEQILNTPIKPKLTRKQKFWRWCANLWIMRRVGLSKRMSKLYLANTDCLDLVLGYDFEIRVEHKTIGIGENDRKYRSYKGSFLPTSKCAGTPEQILAWEKQMSDVTPLPMD